MSVREIVVDVPKPGQAPLSAELQPHFNYTRSTGPILGEFFTGLLHRRIVGVCDSEGRVHVPPIEFDPATHKPLNDFRRCASHGVVVSWTSAPDSLQALALIRVDGSDTAILHKVILHQGQMVETGSIVSAVWPSNPVGSIHDIDHFRLATDAVEDNTDASTNTGTEASTDNDSSTEEERRIASIVTPISLTVTHTASASESVFLRGLLDGRIIGQRRSNGPEVYVPPREFCPTDGVRSGQFVEVSDHGTVTTFAIVNVPFLGQQIATPYVTAYIVVDGADIAFQHLILECDAADVHLGMRVEAVWELPGNRPASMAAIRHFRPSGEPDATQDSYLRQL